MIVRIAWYTSLLLMAVVTVAVQLDRQSASDPTLAKAVPGPARGFAQARLTDLALKSDSPELALREAKLLVERRPIPAESLRQLAQTQFVAGQSEAGSLTIQIAAKRGWRDPAAQESMLRLALAAGDETEAAKRYAALFLQSGTEDELLEELGQTLFITSDGDAAQALIKILSSSDRWSDTFLSRGQRVLPPEVFVEIVSKAAKRGARFSCDTLSGIGPSLAKRHASAGRDWEQLTNTRC